MKKDLIRFLGLVLFFSVVFFGVAKTKIVNAQTYQTVNVKCTCTAAFSACGNYFGQTNVKRRTCAGAVNGAQTCTVATLSPMTFWQVVTCAAAGTPTPTPTGTANACTPLSDLFTGTTLDTTKWTVWMDIANTGTASLVNNQLKLFMPALTSATAFKQMGITSKTKIKGNFSITITSVKSIITPGKQSGSTGLSLQTASGKNVAITRVLDKGKLNWFFKLSATNTGTADVSVAGLTDATSVDFRITRVNGTAKLFYNVDNGGFKLLKQVDNFGTADVDLILSNGVGSPDYPSTSSVFDELKVTCPIITDGTPTPTPTGSTTGTPTPTPTINLACVCNTAGACSSQCQFSKYPATVITTYNNPIKCGVAATFFETTPVAANKNDWCRRPQKTKGDADGNDKVNLLDYFYYVQAKSGGKIPAKINPDFNGDNAINNEDRVIILKSL